MRSYNVCPSPIDLFHSAVKGIKGKGEKMSGKYQKGRQNMRDPQLWKTNWGCGRGGGGGGGVPG